MRTHTIALAVLGLALAIALAGCGGSAGDGARETAAPTATSGAGSSTGSASDVAFAQLMISHHNQAIAMADLALKYASSVQLETLAAQIKQAQAPEVTRMTAWLGEWGAPTVMTGSDQSMPGMDMGGVSAAGMMTDRQMAELANARGAEFDRLWLQMMIAHHQGAVLMARQALSTTSTAEVRVLAQSVVDDQTAEIATMQGMAAG